MKSEQLLIRFANALVEAEKKGIDLESVVELVEGKEIVKEDFELWDGIIKRYLRLQIDIAYIVLKNNPIYLSQLERNRTAMRELYTIIKENNMLPKLETYRKWVRYSAGRGKPSKEDISYGDKLKQLEEKLHYQFSPETGVPMYDCFRYAPHFQQLTKKWYKYHLDLGMTHEEIMKFFLDNYKDDFKAEK